MIKKPDFKKILRGSIRSDCELDSELIRATTDAPDDEKDLYKTGANPTTHLIYRYLSEFVFRCLSANKEPDQKPIKILDWGGGKGYVTYFLKKMGADVICYETKSFEHQKIWKDFDLKVVTDDNDKLPFKDKTFDGIVGFGVLEHVPYDYEALKELNRILKDDGLLFVFNLPNKFGYLHQVAHAKGVWYHDRLYSIKETQRLLKRSGFNFVSRPWHRQLLPKNSIQYPHFKFFEGLDLFLTRYTPLALFATSIEFVARKQKTYTSVH